MPFEELQGMTWEGDEELKTYLDCQLSGWAQDDGLDFPLTEQIFTAEVLRDWEAESQSLAATREIARNHVLSVVRRVERVLLDGEQTLDASSNELLGRGCHDLREAGKFSVRHIVVSELVGAGLLARQTGVFARIASSAPTFALLSRRVHRSAPGGVLL